MKNDRASLLLRGIRLEYFTVGYNSFEGLVAVGAGLAAGSTALMGFGLDSLIEIVAGITLVWRLRREIHLGQDINNDDHSDLEKKALFVVGLTFFALAFYILVEAGYNFTRGNQADESLLGILLAIIALGVMPTLALLKTKVARALGSKSLESEAKETWFCAYLALVLLVGLVLNAAFGWAWADPIAALAMLPLILREGREALAEAREAE